MTIEEKLWSLLTEAPGVAALAGLRTYPSGSVPQGAALPLLEYEQADRQSVTTHDGVTDLNTYTLRLTAWAASKAGAKALAIQVRAALAGQKAAGSSIRLLGVFDQAEGGDAGQPLDGGEQGRFSIEGTYRLWYRGD